MAQAKKISDYKNSIDFQYPSDDINPELKKSPEYHLKYAMAFMSEYASGNCEIPYDFGTKNYSFEVLRLYATGNESDSRVKKNFFGEKKKDPKTGRYPTTINTDWNGIDIMPKFFDVMRAINQEVEFKTTARAIDEDSLQSKELDRAYLKTMLDRQTKDIIAKTKYHPNTPVSLEDIGAETEADVDLFFDSGGYMTQREIASDACVQKTRKESQHRTIQNMMFDDIITCGIQASRNYIDKANKLVKRRYVDVARCAIPHSKMLNFGNLSKFGEYRDISIGELREEFPHIEGYIWRKLARDHSSSNPEIASKIGNLGFFNKEVTNEFGQSVLDQTIVTVFDVQWLTNDISKYVTNDEKKNIFKPIDFAEDKHKLWKGDKVIQKNHVTKHFAVWVVGTETLLDYGIDDNITYYGADGNKIPGLDYFVDKTGNKSLVERCVNHLEDIKLAVVKKRNAIATLPPAPRMVLQAQLLENVWLNGIKQEPEDLMQKFIEKGILVVNNLDEFNKPIFQNAKAVDFVPANVMEDITIFTNEIIQGIERIRDVTGLNGAVDASTPNSYVGLGKSQMAEAAANNALSPTFNCYKSNITRSDADVVKKWQTLAKIHKGLKVSHAPLGINTMQVLELGTEFANSDLGIYTELEFTNDEKQMLLGRIIEMSKSFVSSQGTSGLNTAEYMHLEDLIMSGNFKFAKYVIARSEKKRELMALRAKRESERLTFENQRNNLILNNKYSLQKINDEERKKLLTARVTECEKRITKLYEKMNDVDTDIANTSNPNAILNQIGLIKQEIEQLIQADIQVDQLRLQESQNDQQQSQQVA